MKKKFLLISMAGLLLFAAPLFASSYQIKNIEYNIAGLTRSSVLERNVSVDKKRTFSDESALVAYINDYKQQLENTRFFDNIAVDYTVEQSAENDLYLVTLFVKASDSFHFIGVPYPKYNSNSGFELKLKVKDTNFLGSMNTMTSDIDFAVKQRSEYEPFHPIIGFNFDFDYPFTLFTLKSTWKNDYGITYTFGDPSPEWDLSTGLDFTAQLTSRSSLEISVKQGFYRNFDYSKYDDDTYFSETAQMSLPVVLQYIDDWGNVNYTPYVNATYKWDYNGINSKNGDLSSPSVTIGQSISSSRINWENNFRTGLSVSAGQSLSYNFQTYSLGPKFSIELKGYKGWKYAGLCMDVYNFTGINTTEKIGGRLRGIRDDQHIKGTDTYACETDSALVVNLDLPIHLFSTYFTKGKIMPKLNFEVQVSPFFDFALIKNKATGTFYYYKDGFYAGGLEVIVHPASWKSLQVRGSIGVDLGRIVLSRWLNTDWRDSNSSKLEYTFGVGLHY
jgi:hypothetical protein